MALRPCIDCGTLTDSTRCPIHEARRQQRSRRPRPTTAVRSWAERQRRAAVVATWKAEHGAWCPGWRRPPHPATDLTADDVVPVAATGQPSPVLAVLCRSCNGAKAARQG